MKRQPLPRSTIWILGPMLALACATSCTPATSASPPVSPAPSQLADPACQYTEESNKHVQPRHCDPKQFPDKSKFNGNTQACDGLKGGQMFCTEIQGNYSNRKVQSDGRICYDKNFTPTVIGTQSGANQSWGRVVIQPADGVVVTQFPESAAGCP